MPTKSIKGKSLLDVAEERAIEAGGLLEKPNTAEKPRKSKK